MNYSNFMPLKITLKTDPRWKQKLRKVTLSLQIHIIMLNLNLLPNIISDPSNQGKFVYSKTYYLDSFWLIQIHKHCTILSKKHKSKLQPTKKKRFQKEIPFIKHLTTLLGFDLSFWLPALGVDNLSSSSSSSETCPKYEQPFLHKFPKQFSKP